MMPNDNLKKLYDNVSKEYELPDYATFEADMRDDTKRRKMYDAISADYELPDFETFTVDMGVKKKEPSEPVSPVGSGASQPTSKVDRAAEIRKLTAKAVAGDEIARAGLERLKKEKETGVSVAQQARQADAERKQQQYEESKPKIDQYREIAAQTGVADVNIGELETAFKQAKGANDYQAAAEVEAQLNKVYEGIDRTYIESLRAETPQLAADKSSTYDAISAKLKEGGTQSLSQYEQRFLRDLRNNALSSYYSSINAEMYELRQQADILAYNKRSSLLADRARKMQSEAEALQQQPVTVQSKKRLEEIATELLRIQGEGERLAEETGVTPEILERASRVSDSAQALDSEIARNSTRYGELAMEDIDERVSKSARRGEGNWDAFKNLFMESVSSMVAGIPKVMKTDVANEAEVVEYDWVDELYLWADDLQKVAEQRKGQPYSASEYEAMSLSERLPYMLGSGAGSLAVFATGGMAGASTKLGGTLSTMATAYLTGEPAAYDEAISAGLDVGEAQTFAKFFGAITAGIEGVMPDFKLLAPSVRAGAIQLIKQGVPYKQAIKKSLIEYSKEIGDAALKEGFFEEGFSGLFGDITKETANVIKGEAVFEDTFVRQGPQELGEQVLVGAVLGGGMKAISSIKAKRSDASEDMVMQVAEQGADFVSEVSSVDPEIGAELADLQERTASILNGLRSQPNFDKLPRAKQAHVLSELDRKAKLEESMRVAGVKPESTLAEIAAIEAEVKFILDTGMTASEASLARNKAAAEPEAAPVEVELEPTVAEAPKEESSATLTKEPVVEVSPAQSLITDETAQATDNEVIGEVRLPDSGVEGKREGDAVQPAVDVGSDTGDAEALRDVESTVKEPIFNDNIKTNFKPSENLIFHQGGYDNLQSQLGVRPDIKNKYVASKGTATSKGKRKTLSNNLTDALRKIARVYEGDKIDMRGMSEQEIIDYANQLDEFAIKNDRLGGKRATITKASNFGRDIQEFDGRIIGYGSFGVRILTDDGAIIEGRRYSEYTPPQPEGQPETLQTQPEGQATTLPSEVVSKESEKIDMNQPRVEAMGATPVRGRDATVEFADGVKKKVKYRLIEADQLQPSHLSSGQRNPEHSIAMAQPKERNDSGSKMAQDKIAKDPQIMDSMDAYRGSPIVNEKGEVIQGNNRAIGFRNHYRQGQKEYKKRLADVAEQFGFTKEQVEGMNNPILVREVSVSDQEAIVLGQYDVKDLETGGKQRIDPITLSRKMSAKDKSKLAEILFSGDVKTIKDAIRDNAKAVGQILRGYVNPAQGRNSFRTDGTITPQGMDDISASVTYFMFEGGDATLPEIYDNLPAKAKNNIGFILPSVIGADQKKSLLENIQNAMMLIYQFEQSGQSSMDAWAKEMDLFSGAAPKEIFQPVEFVIAKSLMESKKEDIVLTFKKYDNLIQDKPADMFDEAKPGLSKTEAVKQIFNVDHNESKDRQITNTQAQGEQGGKEAVRNQETKAEDQVTTLQTQPEGQATTLPSEVVSKESEKIDMTQPRVEDVNISPRKKKAEELRAKAEAIRNATKGTAMVAPKAYAAALDAFATILETVDDIAEALKKWRETDEYKALADADRSEIESEMGADLGDDYVPPTPPKKEDGEVEGERRLASRGKRVEADDNYKDKLENYVRNYESVSLEASKEQAQGYFRELQRAVGSGEITQEQAYKQAYDLAESVFAEDQTAIRQKASHPLHKSAFAIMVMQRMAADAYQTGNSEWLTKFNDWLDAVGRAGGTSAALMNAAATLDPLANLLKEISESQNKALEKTVGSGRKKKTIVKELQEEVEKENAEAVDEAVDATTVEAAIDASQEAPAPAPKKKTPSKRKELEEREKKAIDRVKKAFAAKSAPGPMMAVTPENAERVAALKELAVVEIEKGAYTLAEVVAAMAKKIGGIVSKRSIREAVESEWAELSELAEKQKREDLTEMVKDALEGRSADKIMTVLGKALKIAKPDFIKARMKGKRITEKQAIEEIMANESEAREILSAALTVLRNEILEGKHLELAGGVKPANMSQEQWDAARQKRVLSMFEGIVDVVLGQAKQKQADAVTKEQEKQRQKLLDDWQKAIDKNNEAKEKAAQKQADKEAERAAKEAVAQSERELKQAEAAYQKAKNATVKQVIKDYYKNPNSAQSLTEYLAERFPDMPMNKVVELANAVEQQMEKIRRSRDNAAIKRLVNELTDGKGEAELAKTIGKIMRNRGAMSQFGFANLLSGFLGYKGVNPTHIQQLQQLMNMASGMMPGRARNDVMRAANNIAAFYAENNIRVLNDVMQEVMVRNILSAPRTAFTGGLSVFLMSVPSLVKSMAIRPAKTYRGLRHAWNNAMNNRSAIRASAREVFALHKIPVSRELPTTEKPFAKDRTWERVRNTKWKEIGKIWRSDKYKAITYASAKALIGLGLQGKGVGITNFIFDLQTYLDYLNVTALRDIYASIDAERTLAAKGILPKDPRFAQEMADMLGVSDQKQKAIEKQIADEIADMVSRGLPVPKGFESSRRRELLNENTDLAVLNRAHEKAEYEIGMSEPRTVFAAHVNAIFKRLATSKDTNNDVLGLAGFAQQRILQPLFLFSRMALVLGEKSSRYAPIIGPFISAIPIRMTTVKADGTRTESPMIKRDKDGNIEWTPLTDTREYAARLALSSLLTTAILMLLANAYDEEEVVDKDGNPIPDPDNPGETLKRKVYKDSDYIDFYGSNRNVKQEKRGAEPTNSIRIKTGVNPDGTSRYEYWSFSWFPPQLYGSFKMLGEQRDEERFFDDQISLKGQTKEKAYATLRQREDFTPVDIAAEAAIGSFNFEFSNLTKLINQVGRGDTQGIFNTLIVSPGKAQISSKTMEGIEKEIYYMMDRHKIYVNSKADGKMAAFLMQDVWFTDPFIQDREKLESLDPFGNPVDFPSALKFVPSLFMKDVFYGMAEHEQKYKKQYSVFYDEKGAYNPSVLPIPNRYILNEYKSEAGGVVDISDNKNIQRGISDGVSKLFGEYIRENRSFLMKQPYEKRAPFIEYLRDMAIVGVVNELPGIEQREYPSVPLKMGDVSELDVKKILDAETISLINE